MAAFKGAGTGMYLNGRLIGKASALEVASGDSLTLVVKFDMPELVGAVKDLGARLDWSDPAVVAAHEAKWIEMMSSLEIGSAVDMRAALGLPAEPDELSPKAQAGMFLAKSVRKARADAELHADRERANFRGVGFAELQDSIDERRAWLEADLDA